MVNWMSPSELAKDATAFNNLCHATLGLYIWEWATTLRFDWEIVTRKRAFRWPMIVYLLNRYCMLGAMIAVAVALNVSSSPIHCQPLYTFIQLMGNMATGFASLTLSLRTFAIWRESRPVVLFLCFVILGHWATVLQVGISIRATYVPGTGCAIQHTLIKSIIALYGYTMALDFLILILTAWRLVASYGYSARDSWGLFFGRGVVELLFRDGLIYFALAFLGNTLGAAFMVLNLNAVMNLMLDVPAPVMSTIVATRCFRGLCGYNDVQVVDFWKTLPLPRLTTIGFRTDDDIESGVPEVANMHIDINPLAHAGRSSHVDGVSSSSAASLEGRESKFSETSSAFI